MLYNRKTTIFATFNLNLILFVQINTNTANANMFTTNNSIILFNNRFNIIIMILVPIHIICFKILQDITISVQTLQNYL